MSVITFLVSFTIGVVSALHAANYPPDPNHPPTLIWTPEKQDVYNKMKAENHAYYRYIKDVADGKIEVYHDLGFAAMWMYAVTGDEAYAKKAVEGAGELWNPAWPHGGGNETSGLFFKLVWMYDWLYPYLKKNGLIEKHLEVLNLWADRCIGLKPYSGGYQYGPRQGDSDTIVSYYLAVAAHNFATKDDNVRAQNDEFINATWPNILGGTWSMGGLESTGIDRTSMRNEIAMYFQMAKDSLWIESSEYDIGTYQFVVEGVEGLRTATGHDYLPEATAHYKQAAIAFINQFTPDMKDLFKWGDEQQADGIHHFHTVLLFSDLAGATEKDPSIGPYVHYFATELIGDPFATRPRPQCFFLLNPYAPSIDWRSALPLRHYASGQGFVYRRTGWDPSSSYFTSFSPEVPRVDHSISYESDCGSGDFMLYRRGRWILDHPIGYGKWPKLENITMIENRGSPFESRGVVAAESTDLYEYVLSNSMGSIFGAVGSAPQENFVHEKSRHTIYLPSQDDKSDVVITYDRLHAQDPRTFDDWSRYYEIQRRIMDEGAPQRPDGTLARKEWIIHSPAVPTGTDRDFSWDDGGQKVRVSTLLPLETSRVTTDLPPLLAADPLRFPSFGYVDATELKVMNEILPATNRDWEPFLHVVSVTDGITINSTLVQNEAKDINGVVVKRPGHSDFVALFNALPGSIHKVKTDGDPNTMRGIPQEDLIHQVRQETYLRTGYTVTWTAGAASSELFLADLDPNKTWEAFINNEASPHPVPVSPQGVGRLRINAGGQITLKLQSNNADNNPPKLSAFSISKITDTSITLTWTTDEMATSSVLYGNTSALGSATPAIAGLRTSHTITVNNLNPGTLHYFRARSADETGNAGVSSDLSAQTTGAATKPSLPRPPTTPTNPRIPATMPTTDNSLRAAPSVWRSDQNQGQAIVITGITSGKIQIYDFKNRLVQELSASDGTASWYPTESSGTYFVVDAENHTTFVIVR